MVDHLFAESRLAELYDASCEGRPDFAFYLPLVKSAQSVLDVGCGTGELLHLARQAGHIGRLSGLDPANAMLDQARKRADIEWILGDLHSVIWNEEFDLIVMTGHAFQVLVTDADLSSSLGAIRLALTKHGRFAFETRNPHARGWEKWIPENAREIRSPSGELVRITQQVDAPVIGDIVSFTTTFTSANWDRPEVSRSSLRFLDADALLSCLSDAGLTIDVQFGDWEGQPFTDENPEIITIARRAK